MKFGCLNKQNANKCQKKSESNETERKSENNRGRVVRSEDYWGEKKTNEKEEGEEERNVDLLAHQRTLNMAMD